MIITTIICVALLLGLNQISRYDRWAALLFLTPVVMMDIARPGCEPELYYFACAFLDREVLFCLVTAGLFRELSLAAFAAIILNFFGWGLWISYQPPDAYNFAFMIYYAWVLWILLKGSKIHAGLQSLVDAVKWFVWICCVDLSVLGEVGSGAKWKS